jgi:glycosyltransferase involved in cell wall biosynthesis
VTGDDSYGRPVRVAVLDHTAQLGGAELALVRLLAQVDPRDVEVVVVLFAHGDLEHRLRDAGVRVVVVPLDPGLRDTRRTTVPGLRVAVRGLGFTRDLVGTLRDLEVDVVHTTSLKADLAGVLAARLVRRPLVWQVHDRIAADYLPRRNVRLFRALARLVPAAVVANSAATASTLPGARRLEVVHPGLAPGQVAAGPRTAQPPGPPTIGMVGRLSPTKGQLLFVRAARRVAEARPDVRFRIVGSAAFDSGDYEQAVRAEVRRLGLDDRVDWVGFVGDPRHELDRMAVCTHCALVPEPFGQVVTEAMAWGVPVVATRGGGVDEIVRTVPGQETALLVPPGDAAALADAVLAVLDDPQAALARAARAHADVARRFLAADAADALTTVWRDAASLRRTRRHPRPSMA